MLITAIKNFRACCGMLPGKRAGRKYSTKPGAPAGSVGKRGAPECREMPWELQKGLQPGPWHLRVRLSRR